MSLASERNVASARSTLFTASDLMAMDLPSVQQVVEGILYEGLTLFAGKPKMGKTWLMLDLALAVALGGTALGGRPVLQGGSCTSPSKTTDGDFRDESRSCYVVEKHRRVCTSLLIGPG
jgi:hypothetical protein